MPNIGDFKATVSRANAGFLDIQGDTLVKRDTHAHFQFTHAESDPTRNRLVREAFVNALVTDAGGEVRAKGYLDQLRRELLGADVGEKLMRSTVKRLLDRHVSVCGRIETAGPQETVQVSSVVVSSAAGGQDKINVMFEGVGKKATEQMTAKQVLESLPQGVFQPDALKLIEKQAKTMESKLRGAYRLRGGDVLSSKGQAKLAEACNILFELGDTLRQVFNGLVRHGYDVPIGLERSISYCMARGSELDSLCELIKTNKLQVDRSQSVRGLMSARAMEMHGTADFVSMISTTAQELSAKVGELEQDEARQVSGQALAELSAQVESLRTTVLAAGDAGVQVAGRPGAFVVERSTADAMLAKLDKLNERLTTLSGSTFRSVAKTLLDEYFAQSPGDASQADRVKDLHDTLLATISQDGFDLGKASDVQALKDLFDQFQLAKPENGKPLSRAFSHGGFKALLGMLKNLHEVSKDGVKVSAKHLLDVMSGKTGTGTILAASAFGYDLSEIDTRIDDANLIESNPIGSGQVNEVVEVVYRNPDSTGMSEPLVRIFKPEVSARVGMNALASTEHGYAPINTVARLNQASHKAAAFLGAHDVIDPVTVGSHDGKLGLFMQKAESMSEFDVKMLVSRFKQIKGSLLRGLNELAWTDWLTGQLDRHPGNYLVSVNDDGTAVVKGIDNDASFSALRIGRTKFIVTEQRLRQAFAKGNADRAKRGQNPIAYDDFKACWDANLSDHTMPDGGKVKVLDIENDKLLAETVGELGFGLRSMALPKVIPSSMKAKLDALKDKTDAELIDIAKDIMGPKGFSINQYAATAMRLREMVEYAATLSPEKVIEDGEWSEKADTIASLESTGGKVWSQMNYFRRDKYGS